MRRTPWLVTIPLLFATDMAGAAPLVWEGTLSLSPNFGLPPVLAVGTGVATVNGSSGSGHLVTLRIDRGISASGTLPITDPDLTTSVWVALEYAFSLGAGTLSFPTGAPGGGALPVRGLVKNCLIDPACLPGGFVPMPLTEHTSSTGTAGVGVGGVISHGTIFAPYQMSVLGSPWTLGQASALGQTSNGATTTFYATGFAHGPASLTSSTAERSGVVQLVTPIQMRMRVFGPVIAVTSFARLRIRFLPEPGLLLLLGSGAVGLYAVGRRRMRD